MRAFWDDRRASVELTLNATGIKQLNVSRPVPPTNLRRADVSHPVALAKGDGVGDGVTGWATGWASAEGENAVGGNAKEARTSPVRGVAVEGAVEGAGRHRLARSLLQAPGLGAGAGGEAPAASAQSSSDEGDDNLDRVGDSRVVVHLYSQVCILLLI